MKSFRLMTPLSVLTKTTSQITSRKKAHALAGNRNADQKLVVLGQQTGQFESGDGNEQIADRWNQPPEIGVPDLDGLVAELEHVQADGVRSDCFMRFLRRSGS